MFCLNTKMNYDKSKVSMIYRDADDKLPSFSVSRCSSSSIWKKIVARIAVLDVMDTIGGPGNTVVTPKKLVKIQVT